MWTERQTTMLAAMGLRVWSPAGLGEPAPRPAAALDASEAAAAAGTAAGTAAIVATAPAESASRVAMPAPPAGAALPAHPPVTAEYAAGSARSARIATLDWPDLRRAAADCRACGLCDTRRQAVFGSGSTQAHWLVVGEAPGADEDASGEPFVGAAGQLLDAMLRALGLSRAGEASDAGTEEGAVAASDAADGEPLPPQRRAYIANTLKCRPPGNRNPAPEEMARCEPFLQRQIELLRPRLILAMGRFAAQSLLRSTEPLGKLRGRVHRYQGLPLVVTYHPAYLLRSPAEKAKAWDDLCLAAETMDAMQATQAPDATAPA